MGAGEEVKPVAQSRRKPVNQAEGETAPERTVTGDFEDVVLRPGKHPSNLKVQPPIDTLRIARQRQRAGQQATPWLDHSSCVRHRSCDRPAPSQRTRLQRDIVRKRPVDDRLRRRGSLHITPAARYLAGSRDFEGSGIHDTAMIDDGARTDNADLNRSRVRHGPVIGEGPRIDHRAARVGERPAVDRRGDHRHKLIKRLVIRARRTDGHATGVLHLGTTDLKRPVNVGGAAGLLDILRNWWCPIGEVAERRALADAHRTRIGKGAAVVRSRLGGTASGHRLDVLPGRAYSERA